MKNMIEELPPIFEVKKEDANKVNKFLNLHKDLIEYLESIVSRLKNIVSRVFKINLSMIGKDCSYKYMLALSIFVPSWEDSRKLIEFEDNLYDTDNHDLVDIILFFPEVV